MPKVDSVTFKALQTYSDGSIVRWIDETVAGQPESDRAHARGGDARCQYPHPTRQPPVATPRSKARRGWHSRGGDTPSVGLTPLRP